MYDNKNTCFISRVYWHNAKKFFAKQDEEEQHYGRAQTPPPPKPKARG